MSDLGLLYGIGEGLKSGLMAYQGEQERGDRSLERERAQRHQEFLDKMQIQNALRQQAQDEQQASYQNQTLGLQKQKQAHELEQPKLTPGQEALDKAQAKEYQEFIAGGGSTGAKRNLGDVADALQELKSGKVKTGGLLSMLPEGMRDYVDRGAKANQDRVRSAVMSTLKQTLGSQFTEKEGQKIFELAYNPRQSNEENIKRVSELANQLQGSIGAKEAAGKYFEEKGTLRGYKGVGAEPSQFYAKQGAPAGGLLEGNATAAPKAVSGKQYSPSRNQTRITYSDGSQEVVDGEK